MKINYTFKLLTMVIVTFVLFIYACTKDSRMQGAANAQTAKL
jgi:hypothetical protein